VKSRQGRKTIGAVVAVILLGVVAYRSFWYRPPVPVTVVKREEVRGTVHGPGTVQSRVPVTVSAKVTGILEKLHVDQGDRVRKGQLLAELDSALAAHQN